jgi:hypothetical protein
MAGNKNSGRTTRGQELALVTWYESVLPEVFGEVKKMITSKKKSDRLWALEWLKTGVVKMIPQVSKIGGDENNRTPIPLLYALHNNHSDKKD